MKTINTATEVFNNVKDALEAYFGGDINVKRINDRYLSFEERCLTSISFEYLFELTEFTGNSDIKVKAIAGGYEITCRFIES